MDFFSLFGKHEIDSWRDDYTLLAATSLNEVAGELIAAFEEDLKSATWKDGLVILADKDGVRATSPTLAHSLFRRSRRSPPR